jgi:hypothetical protein
MGVTPNFQDRIISSLVSRMMPIADSRYYGTEQNKLFKDYTVGICIDIDALAKS